MSFLTSLDISKNALSAQRLRMDIIAQNIANAETTRTADGTPYVRKLVVFEEKLSFKSVLGQKQGKYSYDGVAVTEVVEDETPLKSVYDPEHADADEDGYVLMPNVDRAEENIDLMAATRSYDANVTVLNAVKAMAQSALSIGK
ncbi:MAG: flagellar basal body rod protein FlgC [Oscillospiraceae bacterium]|jgi:flagellar basal-body rod protein FlgC